jgi:hypothetical protein
MQPLPALLSIPSGSKSHLKITKSLSLINSHYIISTKVLVGLTGQNLYMHMCQIKYTDLFLMRNFESRRTYFFGEERLLSSP